MARISTIGGDRVALKLEILSKEGRAKTRKMIHGAADILMEYLQNEILMYGVSDTGDLYRSVSKTGYRVTADSAKIDITFAGERTRVGKRSGNVTVTRNAAIGFIQQYGRKYGRKKVTKKPGRPYFTDAVRYATPEIHDMWREMMRDDG